VRNQAVIGSPMAAAIIAMAVITLMVITKKPLAGAIMISVGVKVTFSILIFDFCSIKGIFPYNAAFSLLVRGREILAIISCCGLEAS
jgi:hypothetical protein